MEATELRIGNLVLDSDYPYDEIKITYDCFDKMETNRLQQCFEQVPFIYKPIPLTEEWMVKSKAKKVANTYILDRFLFIWKPEYGYWYVMDLDSLTYLTKIEFVHELQNFYFVMQGEELKI